MLVTEDVAIGTRQLVRTYSDIGFFIERDGIRYTEAVDPVDSGRIYVETMEKIPDAELDDQEALGIIVGTAM